MVNFMYYCLKYYKRILLMCFYLGVKEEEKKGKVIYLVCEYCGMIFKGYNKYKS